MADEHQLEISSDMTIYEAEEIHKIFVSALDKHDALDINLSNVSEIDSSGLQLMVALKKTADASEKSVQFSSHSQAVIELLDLYAMTSFFGDPIVLGN